MTLLTAAVIIFAINLVAALVLTGALAIVAGAISLAASIFYQGMVVQLVRDVQDGRRDSSLGELFASVRPVALPLLVVAILFGIGVGIGFILLIIPGLFLLTIWAVVAPVVVVERPGILSAFGRSRELVRGHGWMVFGVIVLIIVLVLIVSALAALANEALGNVAGAVVQWLAGTLTAPVAALAASVLYFALVAAAAPGSAVPEAPPATWVPTSEPPDRPAG